MVRIALNCNFKEAVSFLAAAAGVDWKASNTQVEYQQFLRERLREESAARYLAELQQSVYLALGRELDALRNIHRKASASLALGERTELCWSALKFVADTLPSKDVAYCIVAFAAPSERATFALFPGRRETMIQDAMERGYVADAKGYRFEVPLR